jgi:hypothetical protein
LLPVLIRLVVGNVFIVIFSFWVIWLIDWAVNKKTQTMHTPPYRRLCNLSLWSSHVGNKSRILGKGYVGKMWCYWEHIGGTLGNVVNKLGASLGTFGQHTWKLEGTPRPTPSHPPFKE